MFELRGAVFSRASGKSGDACRLAAAVLIALPLSACRSHGDASRDGPRTGVDYAYSIPEGAERYALPPGDDFEAPMLLEYLLPVYPAPLVDATAAPFKIMAKIVVNETGGVDRVDFDESLRSDRDRLYMASIRTAVASWKFAPLQIVHPVKRQGGVVSEKQAKPCSLWYEFRFTVDDGHPSAGMSARSSR